ncbi:MAG: O-acetylhomoserine aminocarboxypropyltransferase/cysteine synthase [Oscillospiraceae bacterium]|jgi:O-acetylhomoserine (thiol)-lyase|nr:O-acetylhomoserine aminocarboxypropyltransferase/cysteine synthase [Oscillospiraceae bacterium]
MKELHPETLCIQAGYSPKSGQPRQVPIIQSTTFPYDTADAMGALFDLEASGYFYSRLQNPTCDHVAAKIAALEGGTAAMLTSSGQAASFYAVFNIAGCGDHIVSSTAIYGGTYNLFAVTMKRMGVEFTFIDPDCSEEELRAAFRPNTKAVFGETIANPALRVLDIERFAKAAHEHGVPLIVDNTFATPINCRPIEWGADIVTHSTTKYIDGHGAAIGGCIVDSGKFDWTAHAEKYPGLCTPDESYHGVTYVERFGLGGAFITKATVQLMRDFGSCQSPQSAFLVNLGLESLPVRIKRHCENAQQIAEHLQKHEKIAWIRYCGLESDPYHARAKKYLPNGSCGVISFGVKGGRAAAAAFMGRLKLASIATHVADARTCCLHPAGTTHRQMSDAELAAAGVSPDMIRLSCGLENAADLIADIDQALGAV